MPHIANIDYPAFYVPAFTSPEESSHFYGTLSSIEDDDSRQRAKRVLHQAARMLWLSDRMDDVARGRPALQVLFFSIAAEAVAKIVFRYHGTADSGPHVRRFFAEICSELHRERLARAFEISFGDYLSAEQAVQFLYKVRCDVAHEGRYFDLNLPMAADDAPAINVPRRYKVTPVAHITAGELRQIVLEGAVLGAKRIIAESRQ